MFKIPTYLILNIILFSTCSKKKVDIPNVLKIRIQTDKDKECACNPLIDQYLWENKIVYVLHVNAPNCDTETLYYDENGIIFKLPPNIPINEILKEGEIIKNIWTCKNEI
jgi:hypothetical protein